MQLPVVSLQNKMGRESIHPRGLILIELNSRTQIQEDSLRQWRFGQSKGMNVHLPHGGLHDWASL